MTPSASVLCVIPARGGSKGLLEKNIRILRGEHLVVRPIKHMLNSGVPCHIYVTTDSPEIQRIVLQHGADCPDLRASSLATDLTTTEDTLRDALIKAEEYYKTVFDYCIFLTATDVYREPDWIRECYDAIIEDSTLESVFIGYNTTKNYWEYKDGRWIRVKQWMKQYSSRQIRKSLTREDTGVCCISKSELWRLGRRVGDNVKILIKDSPLGGLDIHNQFDLDLSEFALDYFNET